MKRYLLFVGDVYYPLGGFADYRGCFGSLEEATTQGSEIIRGAGIGRHWFHVADTETWTIVFQDEIKN